MAEGFELYHVPQQTRRDKLRTTDPPFPSFQPPPSTLLTCTPHGYDDLLTCTNHPFPSSPHPNTTNPSLITKQHPPKFMGFQGNSPTPNPNDDHHNPQFIYPPSKLELYSRSDPILSRQGLSLSLSSNNNHHHHQHQNQNLPMEVNFQYQAPPGPFTGYTSILKDSVFLRPAQLLLQEMCEFGGICSSEKIEPDPSLLDPPADDGFSGSDDSDESSTISRLISMLDEVYRRYRQYCQHLQAVVASFESIPGLNNAAPFINFALKSLSKHFKCLKNAITDQLQFMSKSPSSLTGRKHAQSDENDKYFALYSQRPAHNSTSRTMDSQPIWRPQRGLPERAVSVLRSWLFEHFLHPYPTDTDKMMLAKQTGLSRNQVSNWFINARVRLWKPMVEEIHALETHQQGHQIKAAASSTAQAPDHARDNPSSSSKAPQDANYNPPEKRVRNELVDHHQDGSLLNLQYGHQFGVGSYPPTNQQGGGSNGVSLTLALHQNNHHGMNGLLDPYPTLALAHRYGLSGHDDNDGGFSTRDVMGGQLSHGFIG